MKSQIKIMNNENFISELRNKLLSEKFKEYFDDTTVKATIFKILDEKEQLQQRIDKAIEYIEKQNICNRLYGNEIDKVLEILKGEPNNEYEEKEIEEIEPITSVDNSPEELFRLAKKINELVRELNKIKKEGVTNE